MLWTRRSVLAAGVLGAGALTAGCGPGLLGPRSKFLAPDQLAGQLQDLVDQTGRDAFRWVSVAERVQSVEVLMTDVSVVRYVRRDQRWEPSGTPNDLDPELHAPVSMRLADLPLDLLPEYEKHARAEETYLVFRVDEVGRLQVWVGGAGESGGLKLDGSGRVAELSDDVPADVAAAVREIVEEYGDQARRVGGFNDFVHVDLNVEGFDMGMRVVRYETTAPQAGVTAGRFPRSQLFDPLGVDPTLALELRDSMPDRAKLKGKAWDWEVAQPPWGGKPVLSYGIGEKGPSSRVWVDGSGKITNVSGTGCPPGKDWCPA